MDHHIQPSTVMGRLSSQLMKTKALPVINNQTNQQLTLT